MLRKIKLYGRLAKFIGHRVLEADVASAAEAVRFLCVNFPQLEKHMADQHYRVSVGKYDLTLDEIHDPAGQQDIDIVPVVAGAGVVGRILAGVALVALSFVSFGAGAFAGVGVAGAFGSTALAGIGASLILGGIAQLLTPMPKLNGKKESDPRESYNFSGIQNTSRQGVSVPLIFGEILAGSIVISASIDIDQVQA